METYNALEDTIKYMRDNWDKLDNKSEMGIDIKDMISDEIITEEDIDEHIKYLSNIDWTMEEYKPYGITEDMASHEIVNELSENHRYEISVDLFNQK